MRRKQAAGKLFGANVSDMSYAADEVGRGPALRRGSCDEVFVQDDLE